MSQGLEDWRLKTLEEKSKTYMTKAEKSRGLYLCFSAKRNGLLTLP